MEGKYSKGPWTACQDGKCSCKTIWSTTDDHPVANIVCGKWGDDYPSIRLVKDGIRVSAEAYMELIEYGSVEEEIAQANAKLIAAAPELADALVRLLSGLVGPGGVPYDHELEDRINDARAALIKAGLEA